MRRSTLVMVTCCAFFLSEPVKAVDIAPADFTAAYARGLKDYQAKKPDRHAQLTALVAIDPNSVSFRKDGDRFRVTCRYTPKAGPLNDTDTRLFRQLMNELVSNHVFSNDQAVGKQLVSDQDRELVLSKLDLDLVPITSSPPPPPPPPPAVDDWRPFPTPALEQLRQVITQAVAYRAPAAPAAPASPWPVVSAAGVNSSGTLSRGYTRFWACDFAGARDAFAEVLATGADDARAWYYKGLAEVAVGDVTAAEESLIRGARAQRLSPSNELLAALERVQGQSRELINLARRAEQYHRP